eukprot:12166186-Alexandrium_andersonii.AAC.1
MRRTGISGTRSSMRSLRQRGEGFDPFARGARRNGRSRPHPPQGAPRTKISLWRYPELHRPMLTLSRRRGHRLWKRRGE